MSRLRPFLTSNWRPSLLGGGTLLAVIVGASMGYFMRLDLPDVRALEDYNPPVMSRVLAVDHSTLATFAEQRRVMIDYHDIPVSFQQALIAIEDSNFHRHTGIDFRGIARAVISDVRRMRLAQGASTLTQQLARNLFLHPEKTITRKVQEALLALEIERQYTKQEILRYYANQVYMGHGRYGLEAAARYYFGKPARELTLVESATIAGLIQRPEALSPFKNAERSLRRRNHVLGRMAVEGFISKDVAEAARQESIETSPLRRVENPAPYFVENVRRWLQENYGSSSLYKEGFEVRTTLDPELQNASNIAMDRGLRRLDKRQGWRGVVDRVPDGEDPETWEPPSWKITVESGSVADAVVTEVDGSAVKVRVGPYAARLTPADFSWTDIKQPKRLAKRGDMLRVRLGSIDEEQLTAQATLDQEPLVEAALVAIDPSTGEIRALVGGFDFERSEFDRATQARRQTGSAFKPLVYAAALDAGWSLGDRVLDEPTVFLSRRSPDPYQPENYTNTYYSTVTLRKALEKSANIATVKLLNEIGYDAVIDTAHRLGIRSELQPFPSLALGAFEISLLDLTSAYGTFANQGVLVEPHLIREVYNRDSALVQRFEPGVRDAVSPQIAYLMNRVLEGVITDGTGRTAKHLGKHVAGKTGTTDNNTDAWFVGYTRDLAVGVWVGFDDPQSLGSRETGALAALPIWQAFMEKAIEILPLREFQVPPGITIVTIDRETGLRADRRAGCDHLISEVYLRGTEPTEYCSAQHHDLLQFPYPFQRFPLNEQGQLMVPDDRLREILDDEVSVFLIDNGRRLETRTPGGVFSIALSIEPPEGREPLPSWVVERFDTTEWNGLDGRTAEVIWLRR